MLPYQRNKGSNLLKSIKRYVSKLLPEHTKLEITLTGKKLISCFSIKDKAKFEHQHDLVYYANCTKPFCRDNYVRKSGRRIIEIIKDHSSRDHASYMVNAILKLLILMLTLLTSRSLIRILIITKGNRKLPSQYGSKTLDLH